MALHSAIVLGCRYTFRPPAIKPHNEPVNRHKYDGDRCKPRRPFLRKHTTSDAPSENEKLSVRCRKMEAAFDGCVQPAEILMQQRAQSDGQPVVARKSSWIIHPEEPIHIFRPTTPPS